MKAEMKAIEGSASHFPQGGFLGRDEVRIGLAGVVLGILYLTYLAIYLPFLPNANGAVGHDYGLHFPNLLAGFYWHLQNGLFSIPWFSPSQCGGFPYFPDPNVIYFSVPQFLVFAVSPMRAVQLTFALFSLIGLVGCYILMRRGFRSSRIAAVMVAGLFLFNGFFTYRMLIGHLTFHAFALTPLMIAALLPASAERDAWSLSRAGLAIRACIAGLCLAYMFQSGMVHGIPPALLATVIVILIHVMCFGWNWQPWLLLIAAGAISLALCAGKLVAELALLSNFPRDDYPLPGIVGSLGTAVWALLQSLFLSPPQDAAAITANTMWVLERHEWEYGLSVGPVIVLVIVAAAFLVRRREAEPLAKDRALVLSAILILLLVPLAINCYQQDWNRFLKSLPYFASSSNLLRFFSAYIPVVIVLTGVALDRLPVGGSHRQSMQLLLAGIALCIMVVQNVGVDRSYYLEKGYPIAPIEAAYSRAKATQAVMAIEGIGGGAGPSTTSNDAMISGLSQRDCYQPLLGYRLEKFPVTSLRSGPVIDPLGTAINMKNPACYAFPADNSCKPGDHFKIGQLNEVIAFLSYRPFPFEQPLRQIWATWLSLMALIGVIATLLTASAVSLMNRSHPDR